MSQMQQFAFGPEFDLGGGGEKSISLTEMMEDDSESTLGNQLNDVDTSELYIHHLDVDQGDATIIAYRHIDEEEEPKFGLIVLVDGGHFTRGGGLIDRYLQKLQIPRIDVIISTHYDADHLEGLTRLLDKKVVPVTAVFQRSVDARSTHDSIVKFRKAAQKGAKSVEVLTPGNTIVPTTKGKLPLVLTCLSSSETGEMEKEENDYGITLLLTYGKFRYYIGGDVTSEMEDGLAAKLKGKSHLCAFKCGHHGSRHSTSQKFLTDSQARCGFISCGKHSYAHPHQEVIDRLQDSGHVKRFFLTNCYYNRARLNPNYRDTEAKLIVTSALQLQERAKSAYGHWRRAYGVAHKLLGSPVPPKAVMPPNFQHPEFECNRQYELTKNQTEAAKSIKDGWDSRDLDTTGLLASECARSAKIARDQVKSFIVECLKLKFDDKGWNIAIQHAEAALRDLDAVAKYATNASRLYEVEQADRGRKETMKGRVAGDKEHLGSVILWIAGQEAAVDAHTYLVGYWESDYGQLSKKPRWHWQGVSCRQGNVDVDIHNQGIGLLAAEGVSIETLIGTSATASPNRFGTEVTSQSLIERFSLPSKAAGDTKPAVPLSQEELDIQLGKDFDHDVIIKYERDEISDKFTCPICGDLTESLLYKTKCSKCASTSSCCYNCRKPQRRPSTWVCTGCELG